MDAHDPQYISMMSAIRRDVERVSKAIELLIELEWDPDGNQWIGRGPAHNEIRTMQDLLGRYERDLRQFETNVIHRNEHSHA